MSRDARIDRYIQARAPFARPILRRLRTVIRGAHPELEEAIKWGMPTFLYRGKIVCGIAGFKAHCALWFKNARAVVGGKRGEAMGQFGRLTRVAELPSAARIRVYVRKAVRLIDSRGG